MFSVRRKQDATNFHYFHSEDADAMNHKMDADGVTGHMGVIKKPRGRLTAYAFFLQACREEQVQQGQIIRFSEFARKCARQWNMLPDIEKEQFYVKAQQDKERYTQEYNQYIEEMQNSQPSKAMTMRRKKQKRTKDPNEPKRALTAFFYYCFDERKTAKELNPQLSFGGISKVLGRMWSEADDVVRQKYEQMAERDKLRYEQEMTEYAKTCIVVKDEGGPSGLNLPQQQDVTPTPEQAMTSMQIGDFTFTALYPQMELQELPEYTITYLTADEILPPDETVTAVATLQQQANEDMYEGVEYVEVNDHD
ncbi:high mobility group protein DSP1-like [Anopheles coustani]|uniref:high mobility group protein DSP1-like n=1 Tax=Anopheles coustani TaxID=139045 RepID=UPI00265B6CA6|nr:high mobility group protein DSP1-like [Anopheles coustani]